MIGEMLNCDFYLIPSSIHDNLIMPDTGMFTGEELVALVRSINSNPEAIKPEDILSDDILWCSRDGDKVVAIKYTGGDD